MATPEVGSTNAWLFDGVILNFGSHFITMELIQSIIKPEDIGS